MSGLSASLRDFFASILVATIEAARAEKPAEAEPQ